MAGDNGAVDAQQQALDQTIKEIQHHASRIYELMLPGMTIDLSIPNDKSIIVPNARSESRRLILTRPSLVVKVMPK